MGFILALSAAFIYSLNTPLFKLFSENVSSGILAAVAYSGATIGLFIFLNIRNALTRRTKIKDLTNEISKVEARREWIYIIYIIALDAAASLLVLESLKTLNASTTSMLQVLETVATAIVAAIFLHETMSIKMVIAIVAATAASVLVSIDTTNGFQLASGAILVVLAALCWGIENCLQRKVERMDPPKFVMIKCAAVGVISLIIAFLTEVPEIDLHSALMILIIGMVAYGAGILLFFLGVKYYGAAKASTIFALNPIMGAVYSLFILGEEPNIFLLFGILLIILSIYLTASDHRTDTLGDQIT